MSFSIEVKANSKEDAKIALADKFDSVVVAVQSVHAKDRDMLLTLASAQLDTLRNDNEPNRHFIVRAWGSLSFIGDEIIEGITTHCEVYRGVGAV